MSWELGLETPPIRDPVRLVSEKKLFLVLLGGRAPDLRDFSTAWLSIQRIYQPRWLLLGRIMGDAIPENSIFTLKIDFL